MADTSEVFKTLVDGSDNGVAQDRVVEGDTAASVNASNVLTVKDSAGNLQNINSRDEGDATSTVDALPVLPAKDSSGNFAYIPLDSSGKIPVSSEDPGTVLQGSALATPAGLNTDTDVVTITLANSEDYKVLFSQAMSFRACTWEIVQNDNASETVIARGISGAGDFSWEASEPCFEFTSGGTGTQELIIRGQQKFGGLSDMRANAVVLQKA